MRKYILVLILLVAYCYAHSQIFQTNNSPYKFKGLKADSMVVIPSGADTTVLANPKWGESMNGAIFFKYTDSSIWGKYQNRWRRVSGGGSSVTPSAMTKVDDTNVTLNFSGNNTIALLEPVQLQLGWTGTLADDRITSAAKWNAYNLDSVVSRGNWTDDSLNIKTGSDLLASLYGRLLGGSAYGGSMRLKNNFNTNYSDFNFNGFSFYNGTVTQSVLGYSSADNGGNLTLPDSAGYLSVGVKVNGTTVMSGTNGIADLGTIGGAGTVTSVGLTMPSAFSVSGSPVTSSGTLAVTGAGTTSQYIRGDGSLETFPTLLTIDSIAIRRAGILGRNFRSYNAGLQATGAQFVNQSSTTADSMNLAIGYRALESSTSGYRNIALGDLAGLNLTTGYGNYFGGYAAGSTNSTGANNVAFGTSAYGGTGVKTGSDNLALGQEALRFATSGDNMIGIGGLSGRSVTTATGSIFIGGRAGQNITTGLGNVVVAYLTSSSQMGAASSQNTHVGNDVGAAISGTLSNTAFFGSGTGNSSTGANNTGIGTRSLRSATGANNTALGYYSGTNGDAVGGVTGVNNTMLGAGAKLISQSADNQFTVWVGAASGGGSIGQGGYNVLSRNSSGQWIFNQTTSEVTTIGSGAAVEINGTTGGLLIPRLTSTQRTAISSPATGLQLFDTDSASVFVYDGTEWEPLDKSDYVFTAATGEVTMTSANTYYDALSVTLPAGTWDIQCKAMIRNSAGSGRHEAAIWNGSAYITGDVATTPAVDQRAYSLSPGHVVVITGSTTYTLRGYSTIAGSVVDDTFNSVSGLTWIKAVRIR